MNNSINPLVTTIIAPHDAQYHVFGSYYKVGNHGYLYRFDSNEWVRSTNSVDDVIKEDNYQRNLFIDKEQLCISVKAMLVAGNTINYVAEYHAISRYRVQKMSHELEKTK